MGEVERDANGQIVVRVSKADADAYSRLDNRGQPSVSPTERRTIDAARIAEHMTLRAEVGPLRERLAAAEADIRRLKETWQARIEDEVRLRMRGYSLR